MNEKKRLMVTKKKGALISLPLNEHVIIQPNRVTNARFEKFSLYQTKILVAIMSKLQNAIQHEMNGGSYRQLDIFSNANSDITISIPFQEIASFQKYEEVKAAIETLRTVPVSFKSSKNEGYIKHTGLITSYEIPESVAGKKKYFYLNLDREVAELLIKVDKKDGGVPINFTKYIYAIAMGTKNQYTARLYMIISSWRAKGGFTISLQDLKYQLGINDSEYSNFANFKKRVLIPAQKDLENLADCWFNCAESNFEVKEGKKVTHLNFKIISPELMKQISEKEEVLLTNIKAFLETHIKLSKDDVSFIMNLVKTSSTPIHEIFEKIVSLITLVKDKNDISNKQGYFMTSIKKYFEFKEPK